VSKNQPAIRWKPYQTRIPELDEVSEWWGNGRQYGIALICGAVSGGLEMTELEARALDSDALTKIANAADLLGCGDVWDRLSTGYTQASPSGGLHLAYRIVDHEVPGNEKIALDPEGLVRAETRGEGGYFIGAGSPGSCHPSGEPWLLSSGEYGVVPHVTWDERNLFHAALKLALDTAPPSTDIVPVVAPVVARPFSPETLAPGATSISPGDDWSSQTDWAAILEPHGWKQARMRRGEERFWVRPGKDERDGFSASTDYDGKQGFYVWSTSAGLETETPLSKLFVYAHYSFRGDMKAAAQDLKRRGFGSVAHPNLTAGELDLSNSDSVVEPEEQTWFSLDDVGNATRLWHLVGRKEYRYIYEEKEVYRWSGKKWEPERSGHLEREWFKITEAMERQGVADDSQSMVKWAKQSRSQPRTNAAVNMMRVMEGATISTAELNLPPMYLNMDSGTYNIQTQEQETHNRDQMMTRKMNASFDPEATCPKFESFMEQVLPDPEVRAYVQRAVGYSLLGKADHRAFFLIYGPSGTGKSQFLSTMEYVFGDYAASAAEGTFRIREGGGPNNDLHGLRGKRFVSTSETAENTNFNETLLKRITGTDLIVSREMYQTNQTWRPECSLWLATNHPPRFNSDDDAIWKRAKLVPFMTRFGTDMPEVPNFARDHLYAEANGILNWILAGLHDFLANGLQEPGAVQDAAKQHREQSDSVIRFLEDQLVDGNLEEVPGAQIRTSELFAMYEDWCKKSGERGLGNRRFINRLESSGRATYTRTSAHSVWRGLHRSGVLGQWVAGMDKSGHSG
jgi:putative DNA primase/helicase